MTSRFQIILIVSFILIGNQCMAAGGLYNTTMKSLDINSNGKKIDMKVGDEIQIALEGAGATGYWWHFDGLDHGLFELTGEETLSSSDRDKKMTGGPVIGIWKLKAKKPGRGVIRMKYYRAWEKSDTAINEFELKVDIKP